MTADRARGVVVILRPMRALIQSLPRPLLCVALLACGCAALHRAAQGGDGSEAKRSKDVLGCPQGDIVITDATTANAGMYFSWTATGCGRTTQCHREIDENGDNTECGAVTLAPLPAGPARPAAAKTPVDPSRIGDVRADDLPPPPAK